MAIKIPDTTEIEAVLVNSNGISLPVDDGDDVSLNTTSLLVSGKDNLNKSRNLRVDNFGTLCVTPSGAAVDAFGRQRVSESVTLFDSKLTDENPLTSKRLDIWDELLVGTATSVYNLNRASITLSTVAVGDRAVRQTRTYFNYQPGKSQRLFQTFNLSGFAPKTIKLAGLGDDLNGLFFRLNGLIPEFVVRSKASGVAVDNPISQSNWNVDRFDGTGPSGVTLDFSRRQILHLDFEWLGVGSVRFGFVVDGNVYYAHRFDHANVVDALGGVYMSTPNLPIRYEIDSTAPGATPSSIEVICCTLISEGGVQNPGVGKSYVMPIIGKTIPIGGFFPLFGIRKKITNIRSFVKASRIEVLLDKLTAKSIAWRLVKNPTFLAAVPVFAPYNNSFVEIDTTTIAAWNLDGYVLESGTSYEKAAISLNTNNILDLGSDVQGLNSDTYYVIVEAPAAALVVGGISWIEE